MNNDIIKGHWNQLKGKLKQQWGKLTDDDILRLNGDYDELEGKLQEVYGYQKEDAAKQINSFLERQGLKKKELSE